MDPVDIIGACALTLTSLIFSKMSEVTFDGHCGTNRVRDSSFETNMVVGMHGQTYTLDLQDQRLASIK